LDLKRFAWVVLIFFGGVALLVWAVDSQKKRRSRQDQPEAPKAAVSSPAPQAPRVSVASAPAPKPAPVATRPAETGRWAQWQCPSEKFTIGSTDPSGDYPFAVELTNRGAAIYTLKLARHFATVEDKRLYHKDPVHYEQNRTRDPKKYKGHYSLLNPVGYDSRRYLPLATKSLTVRFNGQKKTWSLIDCNWFRVETPAGRDGDESESVSYSWAVWRSERPSGAGRPKLKKFLELIKTYTIRKGDHSVILSLELINRSPYELHVTLEQLGPAGVPREDLRADGRKAAYAYLKPSEQTVEQYFKPISEINADSNKKFPTGKKILLGTTDSGMPILWLGESNKFFGSFMYLVPRANDRLDALTYRARYYLFPVPESGNWRTFATGIEVPSIKLAPGTRSSLKFDVFAGPKKLQMFREEGAEYYKPLYEKLGYKNTIEVRSCSWAPLTFGLIWLLRKLSVITFGNYGVAIIVLVFLVRVVLHPLTKKSQVSMVKMQKLAPQVQKLKDKYKDDKEALNREMMRFYKQQGASPLLGCLPMLLQMPIWVALFTALNVSVDLRHAAFLPFWITDLAAPDALLGPWDKGLSIPLAGTIHSFNLLPLLLTAAFFLQMKINPQMSGAAQPVGGEQAQQQQKMMKYMMPLMMLLFFYNAPSGLTLYIMASTAAGVGEQIVIRKHIEKKEAEAAAAETKVAVPGKGPRASRPKKPKGPFWMKHG